MTVKLPKPWFYCKPWKGSWRLILCAFGWHRTFHEVVRECEVCGFALYKGDDGVYRP